MKQRSKATVSSDDQVLVELAIRYHARNTLRGWVFACHKSLRTVGNENVIKIRITEQVTKCVGMGGPAHSRQ